MCLIGRSRESVSLVFELANDSYHQLFGATKRQLIGVPFLKAVPDIEPSLLKIIKAVAFKGERFEADELPVILDWNNNGKPYKKYILALSPLESVQFLPLIIAEVKIARSSGICVDVFKEMEQVLD